MNTALHISIIGAGLGGLCLAQGLKKNGTSFSVYEKDQAADSRNQGYRIRIDQTGQHALRTCLPMDLYMLFQQTCARPAGQVKVINAQLETINGKWVDDWQDDKSADQADQPDLRADRLAMREVLLTGIREHVHFGKELSRYEERGDGKVSVHFSDGSSVLSDILIAADGIHSKVRELRFPEARPEDTGNVCFYGKTMLTENLKNTLAPQLLAGTSVIFEKELAAVIDVMEFKQIPVYSDPPIFRDSGLTPVSDYIYWALIGQRARFGLHETGNLPDTSTEIHACIVSTSAAWPLELTSLFALTPSDMLTLVPVKTTQSIPPWESSRVTALGDAIHAMSPASGLGANAALYDAAVLAQALHAISHDGKPVFEAISDYECKLREHSFKAVISSQRGSQQLFGDQDK
ncbi:FAD-dependent oxidoreductase [Undibacterium sp. TJN19]|uniref:FAD-dependent oxidoreductase n=1 Tax=Undibacterium sp. TJN19 TaxID=3413055 RepID=UPI003BF26833